MSHIKPLWASTKEDQAGGIPNSKVEAHLEGAPRGAAACVGLAASLLGYLQRTRLRAAIYFLLCVSLLRRWHKADCSERTSRRPTLLHPTRSNASGIKKKKEKKSR